MAKEKTPELTDFEQQCLSALVLAYGAEHIVVLVREIQQQTIEFFLEAEEGEPGAWTEEGESKPA